MKRHFNNPDEIVQHGGRQLVSGYYPPLTAQLKKEEDIVVLVRTSDKLLSFPVQSQWIIQSIVEGPLQEYTEIEGFFAVPVSEG